MLVYKVRKIGPTETTRTEKALLALVREAEREQEIRRLRLQM